jgi:hypothetical protein
MKTALRLTQSELLQVMSLQVRLDERRKNKANSDKEADEEELCGEERKRDEKSMPEHGQAKNCRKERPALREATGNDWQLVPARKNRAGVDEGDWHCVVFFTEWAVALLVHVSDDVIEEGKQMNSGHEALRGNPWAGSKPEQRGKP